MNLAHGDVKVLVLLVAVADCEVLVLLKACCFDCTLGFFNKGQDISHSQNS